MITSENFYHDNPDLRFVMEQMIDWQTLFSLRGDVGRPDSPFDSVDEAKEANLDMLADPIGAISAQRIAPRAEEVDHLGCRLENGAVRFPDALQRNLDDLRDAQLTGLTVDPAYGGIGFTKTFYSAATELVSRADASLMNFFGLQGIADTLQMFASEEIKAEMLPPMASGELSGAMVLTEADAGSDLGSVRTRSTLEAEQDPEGAWTISGAKRFITNGCGDVLLVLARSEDPAKYGGGRGLSFFLVTKSERVQVRRIEEKLGIHGSPTCELYFDKAPARLIGRRGHGLTRYTAWLMAAARLGVAGQSVGISEAALREAEAYADEREQFGKTIRSMPAVASMLAEMRVATEASRALLYATSAYVDLQEAAEKFGMKEEEKRFARGADLLTPLVKYYTSEVCNRVASDAIQVHGGNGFMKDYPVERLFRDARITTIYEGTSQIQIDWAVIRLVRGDMAAILTPFGELDWAALGLAEEAAALSATRALLDEATAFVKEKGAQYRDLMARRLVDLALDHYLGWLLLHQASKWDYKRKVAARFMADALPRMRMLHEVVMSGRALELEQLDPKA